MPVYQHLFGPVPSRRLGRSLGIDLVPFKTCSLDCVFCQLGATTRKTLARRAFVPVDELRAEWRAWRDRGGEADFLTLSGSGEPTLNSRFGEVLAFLRETTDLPTALLSNGTLFTRPAVRHAAALADVVKVSLGAWDQASFERLNRPHPSLRYDAIVEGLRAFRGMYRGKLWVEVFLVPGVNSTRARVRRIAAAVETLAPDAVHLNTAVRPPGDASVRPLPPDRIVPLAELFRPRATVIAHGGVGPIDGREAVPAERIVALLRRRPCTAGDVARAFRLHRHEASKRLGLLAAAGRVDVQRRANEVWYAAPRPAPRDAERG